MSTRPTSPLSSPPPSSEPAAPATMPTTPSVAPAAPVVTRTGPVKGRVKKASQPKLPIKDLFTPWKPQITLPKAHPSWGQIPYPEDGQELKARQDLPPARTSNAQTIPPLWEDRKYRFKPGRYHVSFDDDEEGVDENPDGTLLDQEDNLVIPLLDMRPISRLNQQPRRAPTYYVYENGKPKDWKNLQTLKALNDRRREAIWRITCDPPWNEQEREYLAYLCEVYPNASILEMAERFNWRFKGDFREEHGFAFNHIHEGRTLESIRHEYLSFKDIYDHGRVPLPKRQEGDKTDLKKVGNRKVKSAAEIAMAKFTTMKEWQEACGTDKNGQKRGRPKKKSADTVAESDIEDKHQGDLAMDTSGLSEVDDELFDLAGGNEPDDISGSSTEQVPGHAAEVHQPEPETPVHDVPNAEVRCAASPLSHTAVSQPSDIQVQANNAPPSTLRKKRSQSDDDGEGDTDEGDKSAPRKKRCMSHDGEIGGLTRPISPLPQRCSPASRRLSQEVRRQSTCTYACRSVAVNEQHWPERVQSMLYHSALNVSSRDCGPAPVHNAFQDEDEDSEMTESE
ncbi:uncharacterized protein EI97DRAFT_134379 [Westerdykella ornata]|uniref:Uncharacterized protein n=1 Tax=Westerdykella ornata TaxID=318751 RepID=A0A6A6JC77_WESOR|nr:uncharacterized protein EI97DRAFT_134379 [Westerdykella ornata]KAF2274032.1 hypothetical protein EI97DRAFT_134379 [Westerdykella ornata]